MKLQKQITQALAAMVLTFGGLVASVHAVPITILNGSFETPGYGGAFITKNGPGNTTISGWSIDGSIDYIGTYWQAADGNQSLDMNGSANAGSIEQQISVPGGNVAVNFSLSGNPDDVSNSSDPDKIKTLRVTLIGLQTFTFDASTATHSNMNWQLKTAYFPSVPAGSYMLRFSGMGTVDNLTGDSSWGPALDNVSASTVPDGGMTVALLGISVTGLAYFRRKLA